MTALFCLSFSLFLSIYLSIYLYFSVSLPIHFSRPDASDSVARSGSRKRADFVAAGWLTGVAGRGKRFQPRKVPIQSDRVPFNLYAKRSIEHIVILIDHMAMGPTACTGYRRFDYTRSLAISGQDLSSSPFPLASSLPPPTISTFLLLYLPVCGRSLFVRRTTQRVAMFRSVRL